MPATITHVCAESVSLFVPDVGGRPRAAWQQIGSTTQPQPALVDRPAMPAGAKRLTVHLTSIARARYEAAAAREGLTLAEWLRAAAELAIARGSTR